MYSRHNIYYLDLVYPSGGLHLWMSIFNPFFGSSEVFSIMLSDIFRASYELFITLTLRCGVINQRNLNMVESRWNHFSLFDQFDQYDTTLTGGGCAMATLELIVFRKVNASSGGTLFPLYSYFFLPICFYSPSYMSRFSLPSGIVFTLYIFLSVWQRVIGISSVTNFNRRRLRVCIRWIISILQYFCN